MSARDELRSPDLDGHIAEVGWTAAIEWVLDNMPLLMDAAVEAGKAERYHRYWCDRPDDCDCGDAWVLR